jgi:hypothetical protein
MAQRIIGGAPGSTASPIAAESVSFAVGAAGTTGVTKVVYQPIMNSTGAILGGVGDTSFAWVTGTILTTEVAYRYDVSDSVQLAQLIQGEYAVNYDTGEIRYCKKTTGTSDTVNYSTRVQSIGIGASALATEATANKLANESKITVWTAYNVSNTIYAFSRTYTYNGDGTVATEVIAGKTVAGVNISVTRSFTYSSGNLAIVGTWSVV